MSKFKDFIKRFKYLIIIVGILVVGCIFLIVKKSFGVVLILILEMNYKKC